jgi:hypothetical protein
MLLIDMHSDTSVRRKHDALTGAPIRREPLVRLRGIDDNLPMPLRLHTRTPEGVGLQWSPEAAKYFKLAAPPLDVRARDKKRAAVQLWYRQPMLRKLLSAQASLGNRKIAADRVVAFLVSYHRGELEYSDVIKQLDCTVAWLARRERMIKRLVTGWYDATLSTRLPA